MAFVLAFARGLQVYIPQQMRREWKKPVEDRGVVHLPEATALIVGVGGIGAETARLAAAFGMTVLATDARRTEAPPGVAELHRPEALDTLLPRADFVILTVPHTPATEGFMHRARFQRMKRSAFFINIGRGMTTKLDDLVAALNAGEIAGAALDVLRAGAAAGRASAVDHAERADDAAHGRLRAISGRPALPDHDRQLPRLPRWQAAAQRGRQGLVVLKDAMSTLVVVYDLEPTAGGSCKTRLAARRRSIYLPDLDDAGRADALRKADAVLARTTRELRQGEIALLKDVRLVQFINAGIDFVPLAELPAGVPVATNGGAYAEPMAEHALAMALAAAKRLLVEHAALARGEFNQFDAEPHAGRRRVRHPGFRRHRRRHGAAGARASA